MYTPRGEFENIVAKQGIVGVGHSVREERARLGIRKVGFCRFWI